MENMGIVRNGHILHGYDLYNLDRQHLRAQGLEQVLVEDGREVWMNPKSTVCKFKISDQEILTYDVGIDENNEIDFSAHSFVYVNSKNKQKELYIEL